MLDQEILKIIRKHQEWLDSPTSTPIVTNQDVINYLDKNNYIHRENLPDKERVAMMMAFEFFNFINQGRVSPDSQSPYGCSWHEYYKKFALNAFERAGGVWR